MKVKFTSFPDKSVQPYWWTNLEIGKEYEVLSDYEKESLGHFFLISNYGHFQEVPVDKHVVVASSNAHKLLD